MLKFSVCVLSLFGATMLPLVADEPVAVKAEEIAEDPVDISKISESFGHLIGKNIEGIGFQLDLAQVIKGLQDAAAGKESPMNEMECFQAISTVQEGIFKKQAAENLVKANDFLTENAKKENVVSLEDGKIQYKIEKAGTGNGVEEHFSPLIRYVGKFLDGKVFGASKEDEMISLDDAISGFTKGLIGMKEGEKRTLFIHPELGYGTNSYLPPNSLLTFEVELVKANTPKPAENTALTSQDAAKGNTNAEVATTPGASKEVIR
jgi:peptidylprolyl isomerase